MVKGIQRPKLDLSASSFAKVIDQAFGKPLEPPFDPYANSINYLIASYLIPYVGLTGYVGANPKLQGSISRRVSSFKSPRKQLYFLVRFLSVLAIACMCFLSAGCRPPRRRIWPRCCYPRIAI